MTLCLKVTKLFTLLIESGKLFQVEGPISEIVFCLMFVLRKGFLSLEVISFIYPTMRGKFKHFIQIIRTSVTDKIVRYSIYALINPLTVR